MKGLYWCDPDGDERVQFDQCKDMLFTVYNIKTFPIKLVTSPPDLDSKYDVLFFDWGGMSIGNSMLEHFAARIVDAADKYPGRAFILMSMFTRRAITEVQHELEKEHREPAENIFAELNDAVPWLRAMQAGDSKKKKEEIEGKSRHGRRRT